ncbi:MAG: hypothetical protein L0Y56_02535, partial [Nitrospira sp.]|nr:hypothetical protein [Nitrospira sp.]
SIQFSSKLVDRILDKLRVLYQAQKEGSDDKRQVLWNQQKALEAKLDKAEEKLLNGVLLDVDFSRLRDKIKGELQAIQLRLREVDAGHDLNFGVLEEMVRLAEDVQRTYLEAPQDLKRKYLSLFWEKFLVQDRQVVKAVPTKIISVLIENQSVILDSRWLPTPAAIITLLEDTAYMKALKERLDAIHALQISLPKAA